MCASLIANEDPLAFCSANRENKKAGSIYGNRPNDLVGGTIAPPVSPKNYLFAFDNSPHGPC